MRDPIVFKTEEEAFAYQDKVDELERLILAISPEERRIFFENNEGTLPDKIDKSILQLRLLRRAAQE